MLYDHEEHIDWDRWDPYPRGSLGLVILAGLTGWLLFVFAVIGVITVVGWHV